MTVTFLADSPEAVQSMIGFLLKGGIFMWPLLICSMVSGTVIILRGVALRRKNVLPLVVESEIERLSSRRQPGASHAVW